MPEPGETLSTRYEWIIVTGAIGAFLFGYATGSNDVANAFGTSVGAKTLTLRQAVLLAIIFEFTGALVLGRVSAETIAGGIAKQAVFVQNPAIFAYGMSVVLWIGGIVQLCASYLGLNVSATHCIIGGIVGFAMAFGGADAVFWAEPDPSKIPPIKGVVPIILAWFFSPILTAIVSATIYGLSRFFVLKSKHSTQRAMYVLPILVFSTVMIDIYFVFTKGAKKSFSSGDDWSDEKAAWISAAVAAGCSFIASLIGIPYLMRRVASKVYERTHGSSVNALDMEQRAVLDAMAKNVDGPPTESSSDERTPSASSYNQPQAVLPYMPMPGQNQFGPSPYPPTLNQFPPPAMPQFAPSPYPPGIQVSGYRFGESSGIQDPVKGQVVLAEPAHHENAAEIAKHAVLRGFDYDVYAVIETNATVHAIHENAVVWDEDTEFVFGFLQVISAICVIFAHGAGEVGYMAGPLAVIYNTLSNPGNNIITNNTKVNPEIWIILISAFGLVIGLATYGYKVCQAVGTELACITPARGFAAELATSFVIMIAAQLGLPTSSSQCITGGIIGVALWEGTKGLNLKLLFTTMASWGITTVGMALLCAAFFSQAVYAPNARVSYAHNKNLSMTYESLCVEYNPCKSGQYLKGCGFTDGDPVNYKGGTCASCNATYYDKKCKSYQYLKGCGVQSSGSCTNCTTIKCETGKKLDGCGLLSAGKCK